MVNVLINKHSYERSKGDSTFESSPQYPVHYEILKESDTPTLGTPDYEELEIMRQQGAIPKRSSHRPLPPIPIPIILINKHSYEWSMFLLTNIHMKGQCSYQQTFI
jgi:hypothetical protein